MNKYELVYDLKEHLDTYSQTYDDYIMSYGEADMIYHYIEEKDKEIERLNNNWIELRKWIVNNKHNENTKERYLVVDYGTLLGKMSELKGGDKNECNK